MAPHFASPVQLLSFVHGEQVPPLQKPLLQSALVVHARPLLRMQKEDWQLPPAHSAGAEQIAPPGALQMGAAHAPDLHSLFAAQAVQTEPAHRALAHKASSVQAPLVGTRQVLVMQMLLAQRLFKLQTVPAASLQALAPAPVPSQTFAPQAGSGCSAGALVQVPREPLTLQAWQVPLQSVAQQTLSTHLPLEQLSASLHGSPVHDLQLPPQSMPVSVPFLTPSEQLTQVFVVMSQEGVVPIVQSLLVTHCTQAPLPLQTPSIPSHCMPAWIAG